jgi:purine-binding chemotaxis protein CheW
MDAAIRQLVVFNLADQRYALNLSAVERVVRIAELTALPKAPEIVLGIINVRGCVIPVVDTRRRFGLPAREANLSDHLIIARTSKRVVALLADVVAGAVQHSRAAITAADEILRNLDYVEGVIKLDDGLVFIHDLDTFLSAVEERTLEQAMPP